MYSMPQLQLITIDFQALADALEDPESDPNCKVGLALFWAGKIISVLEGKNWALPFCVNSLFDIHVLYICIMILYDVVTSIGVAASHSLWFWPWFLRRLMGAFSDADKCLANHRPTRALLYRECSHGFGEKCSGLCLVDTFNVCCNGWQFGMRWATWHIPSSTSVLSICRHDSHNWPRYLIDLGADAGALSMQQEIK